MSEASSNPSGKPLFDIMCILNVEHTSYNIGTYQTPSNQSHADPANHNNNNIIANNSHRNDSNNNNNNNDNNKHDPNEGSNGDTTTNIDNDNSNDMTRSNNTTIINNGNGAMQSNPLRSLSQADHNRMSATTNAITTTTTPIIGNPLEAATDTDTDTDTSSQTNGNRNQQHHHHHQNGVMESSSSVANTTTTEPSSHPNNNKNKHNNNNNNTTNASQDVPVPNPLLDGTTTKSSMGTGQQQEEDGDDDVDVDDDCSIMEVDSPATIKPSTTVPNGRDDGKESSSSPPLPSHSLFQTRTTTTANKSSYTGNEELKKPPPPPSHSHSLFQTSTTTTANKSSYTGNEELKKPPPPPSHSLFQTSTTTTANKSSYTGNEELKKSPPSPSPPSPSYLDPMELSSISTVTFTHALFGRANKSNTKQEEGEKQSATLTTTTTTPTTTTTMSSLEQDDKQKLDKVETTKNNNDNIDNNDNVQILTKKHAEKEWRRKRKRQLRKQLAGNKGVIPSFVSILEGPIHIDEEKEKEDEEMKEDVTITKIVVNVDEYLKLGDMRKMVPNNVKSYNRFSVTAARSKSIAVGGPSIPVPSSILSASPVTSGSIPLDPDPKDEGYYEGIKHMAMPEDEIYLSDMQQWLRQNLEFFSATQMDAQMSQSGRRQRTTRGKVGIRCVHCARALLPKFESKLNTNAMKYEQWPPGSVSYPATMDGLYSSCSQRPQLHFKTCPYISAAMRIQGSQWLSGEGESASAHPTKRRKRCREGISAVMYYHIACERIGLLETAGGLRFTRDLNLEPLPLEQARHKVEVTKPELTIKPRQRQVSYQPMSATSSVSSNMPPPAQVKAEKTPCTNEECQQILQEALQEEDDLSVRLACKEDNEMVSDYTFLAIKQMALCHASPLDFVSRGKKTKLMRLGFSGFCCRHCNDKNIATHACRSYSSAPDNLASAISNSFVLHLAKCPNTPTKIKQALAALKKIHSKQMQQLPYGSQRKCFFELWRRMRAADKIVEGQENPTVEQIAEASEEAGIAMSAAAMPDSARSTSVETAIESNRKNSRSAGFPISSNENSLRVLKKAEEEWDPTKDNDNLMDKDDRFLVSDYVFLTMRQLGTALPTSADFRGNRRQNISQRMAGMKCLHCLEEHGFVGSGRSFPSAPDNMASAFNTSLYNHMQACPGVPAELKSAFSDLRKIHSMQCQNLVFGSQRKFFNKVFAKLRRVPIPQSVLEALPPVPSPAKKSSYGASYGATVPMASDEALQKHSFVNGPALDGFPAFYQCLRCRAVPFAFRAPGCVQNSRPSTSLLVKHTMACQGDAIFMGFVKAGFNALTEDFEFLSQLKPFQDLVHHVVGGDDELAALFSDPVEATKKTTTGWWRRLPASVNFDEAQKRFEKMASDLSISSSRLQDQPKLIRYLQTISPNFHIPSPSIKDETKDVSMEVDEQRLTGREGASLTDESAATLSTSPAGNTSVRQSTTAANSVMASAAASPPRAVVATGITSSAKSTAVPLVDVKPDGVSSTSQCNGGVAIATAADGQKEIVIDDGSDDDGVFV
ncbi:unnamed protein product [Cylindrotheca closterium]|uniref:Uncharacterized protein n=1 Tax=Cylindrotheca closterium TaxID=2856 RepID=A0AAD2PWP7_9STRA|nr:unnamed protein product [Cylindrotheca closterium]